MSGYDSHTNSCSWRPTKAGNYFFTYKYLDYNVGNWDQLTTHCIQLIYSKSIYDTVAKLKTY